MNKTCGTPSPFDPSQSPNEGLMHAIYHNNIEGVKMSLAAGANVNTSNNFLGWESTPLIEAAQKGNLQVVQWLIDGGADLDASDLHGKTALMWAAGSGYDKVVQLLIDNGADFERKDNEGKTALDQIAWMKSYVPFGSTQPLGNNVPTIHVLNAAKASKQVKQKSKTRRPNLKP